MSPEEVESEQRQWETGHELYMTGQLDLDQVFGTTVSGETYFSLMYSGEYDGETYEHSELQGAEDNADLDAVIASREHLEAVLANVEGKLESLPGVTLELDAHVVQFKLIRYHHSRYGEVVFWISEEIN